MKPLVSDRIWFFLFIACAWLLTLLGVINLTADKMKGVCDVEIEDRDAEIAAVKLKDIPSPSQGEGQGGGETYRSELAACLSGLDACVADASRMAAYVMLCQCSIEHASYEYKEGRD